MIKTENIKKTSNAKKNGIHKKIKRLNRDKVNKKVNNKKSVYFRKKLFFKKKIKKHSLLSSNSKTIYSDTSSTEAIESSFDYKNELLKIIKKISIKYKLKNLNISVNNINNKINEILLQPNSKINIILDIDQTLVYSQRINNKEELTLYNNNIQYNDDCHFIEFNLENKKYLYNVQVRKGLKEFILKLLPYCNFYISTMANPIYIKEVLTLLNKKYNLILNNSGSNNVFITYQNEKKTLPSEITKYGNFLILDDNICAWDKSYLSNIIPVRKFYGLYNNVNSSEYIYDTVYQYYLFTNKLYCFNENKRQFYDYKNKLPFCCEASWSDLYQLNSITELIIKSYILNKLLNVSLSYCFYNILKNILCECKIYYDGEDKNFFQELILLLGGNYVNNINESTHILIKENKTIFINDELNQKNYNFINVKWIFDSYFSFMKCDIEKYKYKK